MDSKERLERIRAESARIEADRAFIEAIKESVDQADNTAFKPFQEVEPDWSSQQLEARECVRKWLANPNGKQVFRLFGYAGTGKTTLARYLGRSYKVAYATYTNQAASIMRKKGCDGACTVDKLIYKPATKHNCKKNR